MACAGSQIFPSVTELPLDDCSGLELFVFTPLDQIKFFPDFVQVKVRLFAITCCPTVVHLVPALGAAACALVGVEISESAMKDEMIREVTFFEGVNFILLD